MSDVTGTTDELTGEQEGYDQLFGGERLISLFNKTHDVGTERSGIISKAPEDRQSRFYKAGGQGALKFWGDDGKPTADPVDGSNKARRPVNDTVFVLDTEYRLTPAELAAKEMDEDNGKRGVFAGGQDLKAIREAIKKAKVRRRSELVGMRLTLKRVSKTIKGDFEQWEWEAKLEPTDVNAFQ